jgi:hypothetical protein
MSKKYSYIILLIIFSLNTVDVFAQRAEQIARSSFSSTLLLVMEDSNGQPTSLGSGFVVAENIVASNLHVIENSSRGYAKIVGEDKKYNIEGVIGIDKKKDLVLLKVSLPSPPLELGDSNLTKIGETVYAVGNPQGLEGTFSEGIISGIRNISSSKLLQLTAPISPGSSGGAVLNSNGSVIGISVATFRGGQNLNFAIPVNYLKELLDEPSTLQALGDISNETGTKSIVSQIGDQSSEGVIGTQFVWDSYVEYELAFPNNGEFSFSLRNKFREPVKNVMCLVIFYNSNDQPLDVKLFQYEDVIPGGLAKRVSGVTHESVQELTTPQRNARPQTKIEYRILGFDYLNN